MTIAIDSDDAQDFARASAIDAAAGKTLAACRRPRRNNPRPFESPTY